MDSNLKIAGMTHVGACHSLQENPGRGLTLNKKEVVLFLAKIGE